MLLASYHLFVPLATRHLHYSPRWWDFISCGNHRRTQERHLVGFRNPMKYPQKKPRNFNGESFSVQARKVQLHGSWGFQNPTRVMKKKQSAPAGLCATLTLYSVVYSSFGVGHGPKRSSNQAMLWERKKYFLKNKACSCFLKYSRQIIIIITLEHGKYQKTIRPWGFSFSYR